ncbi:MAG: 3-dehydroquinate synthase [Candidatus Kapabacteria bacterium]|nr:3-dehydroquinate synthase [Candidatus Kapabacteria bacterium]
MKTINISCRSGNSIIAFGELPELIRVYLPSERIVVVTDSNIYKYYKHLFKTISFDYIENSNVPFDEDTSIGNNDSSETNLITDKIIEIPAGEDSKSFETIEYIINKFIEFGVDRSYFILGFGGGVVCDITGFAASIFHRGLRFGFIPTTLLAQVDASIGGKNGINFNNIKNVCGIIRQPEYILSDYRTLQTLEQSEFENGLSEIIKTALVADSELYDIIEAFSDISNLQMLEQIIFRTAMAKAKIVESDETETGLRKILNFGHTFGHAVESIAKISHGRAVGIGMIKALELSVKLNNLDPEILIRVKKLLIKFNLPYEIEIDQKPLIDKILKDKKKESDKMNFILLDKIGKARIKEISIREISNNPEFC